VVVVLPLCGEKVGDGECIEIAGCIPACDEGVVVVWAVGARALELGLWHGCDTCHV
jgi:hypothetical protein